MAHDYQKSTVFRAHPHQGLPRMIVRGQEQTLIGNWINGAVTTIVSATAGNFTLKQGSTVLLDAPVTSLVSGNTAEMVIPAAATTDQALGSDYLIIWELTANFHHGPVTLEFREAAHLVRSGLWPMVLDDDLISRHSRLDDLLPPGETNWQTYRELAWEVLNRDLIKKGRRPELVLDSFALIDAHIFKTLQLIFRDLSTLVGDGRYTEFAILYGEAYVNEWEVIQFRYDRDEDNAIDPGELESGSPSLWLGVPPGFPSSVVKGG